MEQTIHKSMPTPDGSWVTLDVYGDAHAPGLVVVPGVMSDARAWRRVARAIRVWPSVTVVNRRGRTPSGPLTDAYSLRTEIEDILTVLDDSAGAQALFGWSYGGLIALMAANERPFRQVIAYEPVIGPFGRSALSALQAAARDRDWDRSVEIVNTHISGFSQDYVGALRADQRGWSTLRRLSEPLHTELAALDDAPNPDALARHAERVDLIVGEMNVGTAPYGSSFEDVRRLIDGAGVEGPCVEGPCVGAPCVHTRVLPGQGHLAHVQAPALLGRCLDELAGR